ncbi:AAA family ATPase [Actinoplanes sp. NPDC089786]|uniref:AAA family ATPase n=1 Tax=Actinoplanes sp. NPDC089786 TaxID=3155185 RepID=UPI00343DD3F1
MDGTETGWGRPADSGRRWRGLLDRARHGSRSPHDDEPEEPADESAPEPRRPSAPAQPLPMRPLDRRSWLPETARPENGQPAPRQNGYEQPAARPANPLDRRPVNPLDRRTPARPMPPQPEPRPMNPLDQRSANPLDQRSAGALEQRSPNPLEQRPVNPLEPRRSRLAEGFQGRADAVAAPPPAPAQPHSYFTPGAPPPQPAYRAAAAVPPPVLPPVARPTIAQQSPAPARIEWRQAAPAQEADRAVQILRRKVGRPRVLAFANPKGGVHKTTATVLAAATIGSVRGRGVLAWDDNELRGTLGLRAGSARHARTIRHLLHDLLQIENMHGDALLQELDGYLRHASDGSYDVLAGEENPRFAQRLDQHTVRRVMDLLRRTHDVICVDTGNNVESVNWQTVMRAADQLVVTTVPREDAAFTADWMLDLLDETGQEDLVRNAVTLISCPSAGKAPLLDDLVKHFGTRTRAVAVVPYDPSLEVGSSIEYADLQPETRAAWIKAASMMIEPFAE